MADQSLAWWHCIEPALFVRRMVSGKKDVVRIISLNCPAPKRCIEIERWPDGLAVMEYHRSGGQMLGERLSNGLDAFDIIVDFLLEQGGFADVPVHWRVP